MSNLLRRIQRKQRRAASDYVPRSRPHVDLPCGGYCFLTATKGWRRISGPRLIAQGKLAELEATLRAKAAARSKLVGRGDLPNERRLHANNATGQALTHGEGEL
jgi:hypothetical protein